jgi:hypothetical protein
MNSGPVIFGINSSLAFTSVINIYFTCYSIFMSSSPLAGEESGEGLMFYWQFHPHPHLLPSREKESGNVAVNRILRIHP